MQAVILCGGKGLRLGGAAKPLAQVGAMPILWHIMKIYKYYGIDEFILCLGARGEEIKEFFVNLAWRNHDFRMDLETIRYFHPPEGWKIIFADTGPETMTGGRIKRIEKYLVHDEFMLTYGDGVADLDLSKLLEFHRLKGRLATVTGVQRSSGYGILEQQDGLAIGFREKPLLEGWINGGFFVLHRDALAYIDGDATVWEESPMLGLIRDGELAVYPHQGFWQSLDTAKDLDFLNQMWQAHKRPWVKWGGGDA